MTKLETLYKRELLPLQKEMHERCLAIKKEIRQIWDEHQEDFEETFPNIEAGTTFAYKIIETTIKQDKKYISLALKIEREMRSFAETVEDFACNFSITKRQRKHLGQLIKSSY